MSDAGLTKARILMVGLDSVGKTTILYKLKLGEVFTTIPTIGFNVEQINYNGMELICWDVGGKDKIRPLWRHYMQDTNAVLFVMDSNDRDRLPEAVNELRCILQEQQLATAAPVLVLANKQDLPNSMTCSEISEALGPGILGLRRPVHVRPCCALSGDGLLDGLNWLANKTQEHHSSNQQNPSTVDFAKGQNAAANDCSCLRHLMGWLVSLKKSVVPEIAGPVVHKQNNDVGDASMKNTIKEKLHQDESHQLRQGLTLVGPDSQSFSHDLKPHNFASDPKGLTGPAMATYQADPRDAQTSIHAGDPLVSAVINRPSS